MQSMQSVPTPAQPKQQQHSEGVEFCCQVPEPLYEMLTAFLDADPRWDLNLLVYNSIAMFLSHEPHSDAKAAAQHYINSLLIALGRGKDPMPITEEVIRISQQAVHSVPLAS